MMEPFRNHTPSTTEPPRAPTLTLKNLPDEVHARLKVQAEAHRRSLDREAIVCLESVLLPGRMPAGERLERARALRAAPPKSTFRVTDIDAVRREGRR